RSGLNLAGNGGLGSPLPNGDNTVDNAILLVNNADNNIIGGVGNGNTISANAGDGINAGSGSDNTQIIQNTIGTDAQSDPLGNGAGGIELTSTGNTITGKTIVDNAGTGITLISGGSATVRGNLIGTTGTAALGNGGVGIL